MHKTSDGGNIEFPPGPLWALGSKKEREAAAPAKEEGKPQLQSMVLPSTAGLQSYLYWGHSACRDQEKGKPSVAGLAGGCPGLRHKGSDAEEAAPGPLGQGAGRGTGGAVPRAGLLKQQTAGPGS